MVNKCSVFGCFTNFEGHESGTVFVLHTLKDPDLRFCNRSDLNINGGCLFICEKHFKEKFIKRNDTRPRLIKHLIPVPTIHPKGVYDDKPSCLPSTSQSRKLPKQRFIQQDQTLQCQNDFKINHFHYRISAKIAVITCFSIAIVGSNYHQLLSHGGLQIPSPAFSSYVATGFAVLDACSDAIRKSDLTSRIAGEHILKNVLNNHGFTCTSHKAIVSCHAIRIISNVFFNNQHKRSTETVVNDRVTAFKKSKRTK